MAQIGIFREFNEIPVEAEWLNLKYGRKQRKKY